MKQLQAVRRTVFRPLVSLLVLLFLSACGGGEDSATDGEGETGGGGGGTSACEVLNSSNTDTDQDGLPDCYEINLGTSPADTDSDGDGLSDFDEVVVKAFDATINNFQFNPRIADVPEISVTLQSLPEFSINFSDSRSTSQTRSLTNGTRSSTTVTSSETYEQSVGEEVSGTIGSEATFPGFGISSSTTYTANQQETLSWTAEQSRENERFRETTQSETSETGVNNASGDLNVLVNVKNNGFQTVTLSSLTLTALQVNPQDPSQQQLVSGMDYDTSTGAFPTFDIAPNSESNALPFRATLSLGKTYELLRDSRNLSIEPTTWRITDQEGRSYTHNLTNVGARSARVVIDYAGAQNRDIEYHYVATVTDFGQNRVNAAAVMEDILRVDFTQGSSSSLFNSTNSGLLSVRNVANNDAINGRWIVIHNFLDTDGITQVKETYDISRGTYSLSDIELAKGETLHLMYLEDKDNDGVGSREEFLHGTSDNDSDSDDDGLSDFDEIRSGWQVPVTASISRTVYSSPVEKDADNDALEDGPERTNGTNPSIRDTDSDGILDNADSPLTVAEMQETAFLPFSQGNVVDNSVNSGSTVNGSYAFTTDRFGNPDSAALINDAPSQMIDVSGVFPFEPTVGASLVFWMKVDPTVVGQGWTLYEHAGSELATINNLADQWFVVGGDAFTIMGDCCDRHSFFPIQNYLFDSYSFADWHMVAVVADDETFASDIGMNRYSVYFNAELYGSVVNNEPLVRFFPNGSWVFAGQSSYGYGNYLGGIDDIRFFKRALDQEELRILYEAQQ